jgi:16S rRNA (cytosine1402-N4)-methyltransferase
MSGDSSTPPPPRRPRYPGTHPRKFIDKYKELQPERYPDDVEKIRASGKTPAGSHRPIMVREILDILQPQPGETAVDCTLGYGGHSQELLKAVQPSGRLLAVDADSVELPKTEARLRALGFPGESLIVRRLNFAAIATFVLSESAKGANVLLADLGLSSMQIDDPARGFTFKADGPLDMRMNSAKGLTAAQHLARLNEVQLAELLAENADEPQPYQIAKTILEAQRHQPIETTQQLVHAIKNALTTSGGGVRRLTTGDETTIDMTVRRVFQSLRIAVNDEFGALDALLRSLPLIMNPGGRVAILTFHSGEDRRVKQAFKAGLQAGFFSSISTEVIRATPAEQHANPRSSSAKLRYAIVGGR